MAHSIFALAVDGPKRLCVSVAPRTGNR